jgi:hypothetical protein
MNDTVEISRDKLSLLEQTSQIANTLWNDPKYSPFMKEAVKDKFPAASIPEVDAIRAARAAEETAKKVAEEVSRKVDEKINAFEKKFSERDEEAKRAKEDQEFSSEIENTKRKYNLTAEGMDKVFKRMKERNNPDVEAAAAWVTDHEPKAAPVAGNNYTPQALNLYGSADGDKEWADLNRNPLAYGDKMLAEMANDFANGNFSKYKEFGGTL